MLEQPRADAPVAMRRVHPHRHDVHARAAPVGEELEATGDGAHEFVADVRDLGGAPGRAALEVEPILLAARGEVGSGEG